MNALIVDWSGIYKADIGVKHGHIVGIGKAGNPDVMDGVTEGMVVGANTEAIAAEKMIVTAGALDAHVHCERDYLAIVLARRMLKALCARYMSPAHDRSSFFWDHYGSWRRVSIAKINPR